MKRIKLFSLACLPVVLLGIFLMHTGNSNAAPTKAILAAQCGSWQTIASPNTKGFYNYLYAVSAVSNKDAWAVGQSQFASHNVHTLIEHWNGTTWSIVTSPNPDERYNTLSAVSADASNDA